MCFLGTDQLWDWAEQKLCLHCLTREEPVHGQPAHLLVLIMKPYTMYDSWLQLQCMTQGFNFLYSLAPTFDWPEA